METAAEVISEANWQGPVGCGFPAVVKGGVLQTAANVDEAAIGFDLSAALEEALDLSVSVVNDADAAGLAEMRWGAGRDQDGVVLMLTLGTGIGTSLFVGGRLMPNTELGHIEVRGKDAEHRAADAPANATTSTGESTPAARRVPPQNRGPPLARPIVVGGGISKKSESTSPTHDAH